MQRNVLLFVLLALSVGLAAPTAHPAELKDFAGAWAMRLGARNIFVLTLSPDGQTLSGYFERPARFLSNNGIFANIHGVRHDKLIRSRFDAGVLHFTTQNANDATDTDDYVLQLTGDHAELNFDGLPPGIVVEPFTLQRVPPHAEVATDWEPNRAYSANDADTPSAAMKTIYDEDQRVRQGSKVGWQAIAPTDADRRQQTRQLLTAGALHTGKDYEEASFIFQHGDKPEDYLLAHTLAMVAVSKGDAIAIWIAAATLDRYLQSVGQKQVLGTQFTIDPQKKWTQDPYDRDLVSDALRAQLGVPDQATQAKQLEAYRTQQ